MRIRVVASLALSGLAVLTCSEALAPPDLVVPIQIRATPDRDTLRLADSLILTIQSDSATPERVVWLIEPRGDSLVADTLVYHPPAAGTEFVRARAEFAGARVGTTVRRVVTLPNAAPTVTVVSAPGDDFSEAPLGDTIVLIVQVTDPDGDSVAPQAVRWYFENADGSLPAAPFLTGDTLHLPVTTIDTFRLQVTATDPAGAVGRARFWSTTYDPIFPARWRKWVWNSWVTMTSDHPNGLILAHSGQRSDGSHLVCNCPVVALTDAGAIAWSYPTAAVGPQLVVGDDGAIYLGRGDLTQLHPDGSEGWTVPGAIFGPVLMQDGALAVPFANGGARQIGLVTAAGSERWRVTLDSITRITSLAVGPDSTLYVIGGSSVLAYGADGSRRWRVALGGAAVVVVPVDDSTILVPADSLYALRPDGSRRWSRPGAHGTPAIGLGRGYFAIDGDVFAIDLADGREIWHVTLDAYSPSAPVLTTAGELILGAGQNFQAPSFIIDLDATTGQERWRHRLARPLTATLLLTQAGDLITGDALGYIERLPVGAGPLSSTWSMAAADGRRTGRIRRP